MRCKNEVFIIRKLIYLLLVMLLLIGCSSRDNISNNDLEEDTNVLKSKTIELNFMNANQEQHYVLSIENEGISSGDVASFPTAEIKFVKGNEIIKLHATLGDHYEISIKETTANSANEWIFNKKNIKTELIKTIEIAPDETTDVIDITL
ncbi:hypothetical protein SAMN05421663_10330 [Terribacillus halophilus]|uniref:Uncharacterized protein n=1 Tax=Terribacillus halophilus TaxID=361279 RepID=A0A1G6MR95_9BACI|nr:hypothetical protein [Terribacillus halophilus]SDC57744.1 hypothetical protein SAMN05421663_10330 [Terribacillus halophilus]